MMKPLVILVIMKMIAQINIFKYSVIIIIIIIINISEYFYSIKVSVLYKYIKVKHLSCVRSLSKRKGEHIFQKTIMNKT